MREGAKATLIIAILLMVQGVIPYIISRVDAEELNPLNYQENWCLSFDGTDDYVSCGFSTVFRLDNFTVETWIKPEYDIQVGSDSSYGHLLGYPLSRRSSGSLDGYGLVFNYNTGYLQFEFRSGGTYNYHHTNKAVWYSASWYHVAVAYNPTLASGNLKFYINGTLDSQHDNQRVLTCADVAFLLGKLGGYAYGGLMDEVRIWNTTRTQPQIQETMPRILNSTEAADPYLIGYWRFDEGTGTTSQDYSNYDNDAALPPTPAIPQWTPIGAPIVPEFPLVLVLPLFMIFSTLAMAIRKRIIFRKSKT